MHGLQLLATCQCGTMQSQWYHPCLFFLLWLAVVSRNHKLVHFNLPSAATRRHCQGHQQQATAREGASSFNYMHAQLCIRPPPQEVPVSACLLLGWVNCQCCCCCCAWQHLTISVVPGACLSARGAACACRVPAQLRAEGLKCEMFDVPATVLQVDMQLCHIRY
jgi:hypothetical protein